jgi:hypothetical protein
MTVVALVSLGILLGSTDAFACSFPLRHHTDQEIKQMAAQALASATTVVDGEVITPMFIGPPPDGTMPVAYIKVSHTWKGRAEDDIATVAYETSCDIFLETKGQKVRILLNGEGIFTASQFTNGAEAVYERDSFNREIDRLLGATRPADFTNPGGPPPPEKH